MEIIFLDEKRISLVATLPTTSHSLQSQKLIYFDIRECQTEPFGEGRSSANY